MENQKLEFKNNDFYSSACCLAAGLTLKRLDRGNGAFVTFVFDDPDQLAEEIIQKHWNRKLKMPTRDLVEAINELKTRIHSGI